MIQQAAGIYSKLSQTEKALAIYGPEYIAKFMDKANDLGSYARFWAGQGKNLDSALEAARKCVELSPDEAYGWDVLSQVYLKQKNYDEALKAAQKALDLAEEVQKAHRDLYPPGRYLNACLALPRSVKPENRLAPCLKLAKPA